jgi:hypothetical protein
LLRGRGFLRYGWDVDREKTEPDCTERAVRRSRTGGPWWR